jgi:hypothetical protein
MMGGEGDAAETVEHIDSDLTLDGLLWLYRANAKK